MFGSGARQSWFQLEDRITNLLNNQEMSENHLEK